MAATTSVRRLVADPSLGVQDMMRILKQFVGEEQSFDLLDLVSCPGHQTFSWKTSPNEQDESTGNPFSWSGQEWCASFCKTEDWNFKTL